MTKTTTRDKVLFLPAVRGKMYKPEFTGQAKAALRKACATYAIDGIFPDDDAFHQGAVSRIDEALAYYEIWRDDLSRIKALIAFSGDFMCERVVQETAALLSPDVPVFLMVSNDKPADMVQGKMGDSLCGTLSVHHNLRMIGRGILRSCRIDMNDQTCVDRYLSQYKMLIDGIESMRRMRIGLIGLNPDAFATTFSNQIKLFELGISLHNYELLSLWGDTMLGRSLTGDETKASGVFGEVPLRNPIRKDDPRVGEVVARMRKDARLMIEADQERLETIARCYLWVKDAFERDSIDAGAVHCWPEYMQFFQMPACAWAMLANLWLNKPVVCEVDICHAIMAKLGQAMTGEPAVILDVNNNGWDPRVFNVFHCSQTPPNWMKEPAKINSWGAVEGQAAAVPFTGVAAVTSCAAFNATVFQGCFLKQDPGRRGFSGWAFVPNLPDVLKAMENGGGIHHFVAMKGLNGATAADILRFRGLEVTDLSQAVGAVDEIENELPPMGDGACRVFSD